MLVKHKIRAGGVEAQCLCKRPPSALSQVIPGAKNEGRERGVERHSASASARPLPSPR
jgi:hypothetical protein